MHPYFPVASLLNPRTKGLLFGDNEDKEINMVEDDYQQLKADVLQHMVAHVKEDSEMPPSDGGKGHKQTSGKGQEQLPTGGEYNEHVEDISAMSTMSQLMWGKMVRKKTESTHRRCATGDATIKLDYERELNSYLESNGEAIMDNE